MFERNKLRLYIAFYPRSARLPTDVQYHTALLLSPKSPDPQEVGSWRYHVKNVIGRDGREQWEYDAQEIRHRTGQLKACMLLGKIGHKNAGVMLKERFEQLSVHNDDPSWRCRHWAWDAVQTLVEEGYLAPFEDGATVQEVWQRGLNFADSVSHDMRQPLPTCDRSGNQIESEIGGE